MIERTGFPLLLHGNTGCGKTMAAGLMYANRPRDRMAAWFSCRVLLRELAAGRADPGAEASILLQDGSPRMVSHLNAWAQIQRADFLVLDDIGTRALSDAQSEILAEILDIRGRRATVYTSNHDVPGLAEFLDHRICSRLSIGTVVDCSGPDQRVAQGGTY